MTEAVEIVPEYGDVRAEEGRIEDLTKPSS